MIHNQGEAMAETYPAQTIMDYEDTDKMKFFREAFKETATVKGLGTPTEWMMFQGQDLDAKQNFMTKKRLASLRHGNPRRSIMCEYWTPLRSITQGLQMQIGKKSKTWK